MINLDNFIKKFISENEIELEKVSSMLDYVEKQIPTAKYVFDAKTYKKFGVLRVLINYEDKSIQPLLFATPNNLASLSNHLWQQQANTWNDTLSDISQRGTFLKKVVLIPRLVDLVCKYKNKDSIVAEFGCGNGIIIKELFKYSDNVYGIDINDEFISGLKMEMPTYQGNFFVKDIVNMEIKEQYDIVICSMLLLDVTHINKALDNIYNVLRKSGKLIIVDINSRTYKALGYIEGEELVIIHNQNVIFHTEKLISGATKAVHNYHPHNYYKSYLENKEMVCLEDFTYGPNKNMVLHNTQLSKKDKERLLGELKREIINPPFRYLVMMKK